MSDNSNLITKEEGKKLFIEQMNNNYNTKNLNDSFILLLNNKSNKNVTYLENPIIFTHPETLNKYYFKAIGESFSFHLGMKLINNNDFIEDNEYEILCSFDG